MRKIGDIFILIRNGASIKQKKGAKGLPITRIETIANKVIDREKMGYADIFEKDKYADYILKNEDILMSHINSEKHLGKVAIYNKIKDEDIIHGMNLLLLRANNNILFPRYAKYYFDTIYFLNQIATITKKSVNQASFTVTALKNLNMPCPSIDKQKKIANTLDKVTNLIELRKKQLERLDLFVKSLFIELIGSQVDNPYNFDKGCIKDVVSEVKYGTSSPAGDEGKYPYLRMGNITYDGHLDLTNLKYITISNDELDKYMVKKGDVLFNRTNSKELVGKTCVFDLKEPMVIAGYIIRVRTNNRVIPEYLSAVLNSKYGKQTLFDMCKSIVGQANINAQELQKIKLLIPPIEIQLKYKSYLQQIDKSKLAIQKSLEKLEILKKSLMQEYFG